jgi:hypothetical protein
MPCQRRYGAAIARVGLGAVQVAEVGQEVAGLLVRLLSVAARMPKSQDGFL